MSDKDVPLTPDETKLMADMFASRAVAKMLILEKRPLSWPDIDELEKQKNLRASTQLPLVAKDQ